MNGKQMLVKQLMSLLGLDETLAEKVGSAAEVILTIDARMQRMERMLGIALGEATNGVLSAEKANGVGTGPSQGTGTGIQPAAG